MTTLLREIQSAALDSKVDICDLLRKCMMLAARLENEEFKGWVRKELNGYGLEEDLPNYRIIDCGSFGTFSNGVRYYPRLDIPLFNLPKEIHGDLEVQCFREPISSLIYLMENNNDGFIHFRWPPELVALYGYRIYHDYNCQSAWKLVSCSSINAIVDTVRTRILEFVLEIEKEAPDAGEALPGTMPIAPDKVINIFNTTILGNVGNVATGSSAITQNIHQEVHYGDLNSLKRYLSDLGLDIQSSDLQELENAIAVDVDKSSQGIGDKTKEWIGKIAGKTISLAGGMSVSLATEIITKAILAYLGLPL